MLTLQIGNPGNMGVMSGVGQGGVCAPEHSCYMPTSISVYMDYLDYKYRNAD